MSYICTVYVANLPRSTTETSLAEHFGTIGVLKKDKKTNQPKIWIYRDKETYEPKGDATVTYDDPFAAQAAVEWFNNKEFLGQTITVSLAESKRPEPSNAYYDSSRMIETQPPFEQAQVLEAGNLDSSGALDASNGEDQGGIGGQFQGNAQAMGAGRGRGKPWQQEGDWPCPNSSCNNINFAFRGECNRCGTARPPGAGGGGGRGGRGRGREGKDSKGGKASSTLFGPNDWACPMCGNMNWAKRNKCNICNTNKPGFNEGGAREGRAGGYKEFDEEELEEIKRRRKELDEDDGEMYDEFGNLKKKFRKKISDSANPSQVGIGKAGWDEDILAIDRRSRSNRRDKNHGDRGDENEQDEKFGDDKDGKEKGNGNHRHSRSSFNVDDTSRHERHDHKHDSVRSHDRSRHDTRDRDGHDSRDRDHDGEHDRHGSRDRNGERDRHSHRHDSRDRGYGRYDSYDSRHGSRDHDREDRSRKHHSSRGSYSKD